MVLNSECLDAIIDGITYEYHVVDGMTSIFRPSKDSILRPSKDRQSPRAKKLSIIKTVRTPVRYHGTVGTKALDAMTAGVSYEHHIHVGMDRHATRNAIVGVAS